MRKAYYIWIIMLIVVASETAMAQVNLQVVTKTIEQTFPYETRDYVLLKGNKSNIEIVGWDLPQVKVEIKLTSKARTKEIAQRELEFQRYVLEKKKNEIGMANYYSYPEKGYKLQSILLATYKIWVPRNAEIQVNNEYGNVQLEELVGNYTVGNRFGNLTLKNIGGNGVFNSYFGDCKVAELSGQHEFTLNKTKTAISGLSGTASINSNLGDVSITDISTMLVLEIDAVKSDLSLSLGTEWEKYDLYFKSSFGEVVVDPEMVPNAAISDKNDLYIMKKRGQPEIKATTTFGTITIAK
ncbi:MAG: DUF4097 family beta strand repeat-containing protein [Cyclobacteriaceae bacterium]